MCRCHDDLYKPRVKMRHSDKMLRGTYAYTYDELVYVSKQLPYKVVHAFMMGPILPCTCKASKRAGHTTWASGLHDDRSMDSCRLLSTIDAYRLMSPIGVHAHDFWALGQILPVQPKFEASRTRSRQAYPAGRQ